MLKPQTSSGQTPFKGHLNTNLENREETNKALKYLQKGKEEKNEMVGMWRSSHHIIFYLIINYF